MKSTDWTNQYRDLRPKYEKLTRKTESLLHELFDAEGIKFTCESRTKAVDSFDGKIARPGKAYENPLAEITDISGIRVILYSLSDVEKVAALIGREFEVDAEKSVNKSSALEPDRFGYLSQHFIVKSSPSRRKLGEWSNVSDLYAEIQVRTVLQHAWASVEHFLVYKNELDAPRSLRRRLFRLSALFELADEELNQIIKERSGQAESYKREIQEGDTSVELNVDSLRAYVENSEELKYWCAVVKAIPGIRINYDSSLLLSESAGLAVYLGIKTLNRLDMALADARGWGEEFLTQYFAGLVPLSTSPQSPIFSLLLATNIHVLDESILDKEIDWKHAGFMLAIVREAKEKATSIGIVDTSSQ